MTEAASERNRRFDVSRDLYPFADHGYARDGAAMHYVDVGEGPPVVMLHGNPTWSFLYRDVIKQLGTTVRSCCRRRDPGVVEVGCGGCLSRCRAPSRCRRVWSSSPI